MKSKSRYVRSNSRSLENHVVSSEKKKIERLQWEGFGEKGFKSGMKERVGDEKLPCAPKKVSPVTFCNNNRKSAPI